MTAKKNILIALMLLLLVAASACALTACNNSPADIGAQIATDDAGNPMYGGETYVMPAGMAFSASASTAADTDTSVTLTANYEPAGTTNQQTNWSVSFANPSSSWATGKTVTDYVTVTSTGINTAEVKCLQAFGEQIIVTATSADNSSVSDTTTVDYKERVEDYKLTLYYGDEVIEEVLYSELLSNQDASVYMQTRDYFVDVYVEYTGQSKQYKLNWEIVSSAYTVASDTLNVSHSEMLFDAFVIDGVDSSTRAFINQLRPYLESGNYDGCSTLTNANTSIYNGWLTSDEEWKQTLGTLISIMVMADTTNINPSASEAQSFLQMYEEAVADIPAYNHMGTMYGNQTSSLDDVLHDITSYYHIQATPIGKATGQFTSSVTFHFSE